MYQITPSEIQKAMGEAMLKRASLPGASPDSVIIETKYPGQFYHLFVRMNSAYKVLPTPDNVIKTYNQTGQKGEGAKLLMMGAVQIVGNRVRVTVRIVQTETTVVLRSSLGDGDATSYEGLYEAVGKALMSLNVAYVC
jgi:hypothetical protein